MEILIKKINTTFIDHYSYSRMMLIILNKAHQEIEDKKLKNWWGNNKKESTDKDS